jgi:acyl-CoA synthetase (AMP-forming)/AMP-acid ligase II
MTIYRSPHPDVAIPDTPLAEFVLARARERGARPALVDGLTGRTISYAELADFVDRAAASLSQAGLRQGDVCPIFSCNTIEYPIAVLAIARLGAITTTANPLSTVDELTPQLQNSGARFLFTFPGVGQGALEAAQRAHIERVFSFGEMSGATPFDELLTPKTGDSLEADARMAPDGARRDARNAPTVTIDPNDIVVLPYSSGTTGLPKGVMLTHRNLVANILQLEGSGHYRDGEDTIVCFLPFFHIYGLTVLMLAGLWRGATLVVMPRFDLPQYLDLVERYRATFLHVVPPVVLALAKHPAVEGRDFSSVRRLFSGAAPLGADVIARCSERVGCAVQQGYGLTETSPVTHVAPAEVAARGSIGVPAPNTECRLVDAATGAPAAAGGEGELWIRGPQIMRGYFNNPGATRATVDDEGWLHTGDIARVDEDGNFYIVDRLKELIKYKGMQIAPAELESILIGHPSVSDAAVIPVPDEEAGEIPKAFVVRRDSISAEDLMAFVAARVAPYKKVRRVEFVEQIPKSASGKILRRVLREREARVAV